MAKQIRVLQSYRHLRRDNVNSRDEELSSPVLPEVLPNSCFLSDVGLDR